MNAYARIFRVPHMRALYLSMLLARLPIGLNALATVLFLRETTGSFAVAGAPPGLLLRQGRHRLPDRRGAARRWLRARQRAGSAVHRAARRPARLARPD